MTAEAAPGRIITFYSYKGGTGRSMAMANVAWVLASSGKRVLAVDWDLEAPGLHRYFHPFLVDKDLSQSEGVIDLVFDYATEAASLGPTAPDPEWIRGQANILRYASSLQWEFPRGGCLDFIPAGRQCAAYSTRVNAFDWQAFYERLSGGAFIEAMRERMRTEYDFVLIDSRTGVSDTSGLCTVQLPDALVVCFTLNNQSIDGASAVATSVKEQRGRRPVDIFPMPTRIDGSEKDKLDLRWDHARRRFALFLSKLTPAEQESYWRDVAVPYVPYYSYEELLTPFGDRHRLKISHIEVWESLARLLAPGVPLAHVQVPDEQRQRILSLYENSASEGRVRPGRSEDSVLRTAEDTFAGLGAVEQAAARQLFTRLVRLASKEEGGEDALAHLPLREAEAAGPRLVRALADTHLVTLEACAPGEEQVQLGDAALLRWGRLRSWLEDDREFLLWRQQLGGHLQEWERTRQLPRNVHLAADAERWKDRLDQQLSPAERAFIKEARAAGIPATSRKRFDAFLCYSREDQGVAGPLRRDLEQFIRPRSQARKTRVFDSATELDPGGDVASALGQALGDSEYLILLASPASARSSWVQWALNAWIGRNGASRILIVLVEGDIVWSEAARDFDFLSTTALPRMLRGVFREQPVWCDVRHARHRSELSLDNPQFQDAVATLTASLYQVPKQDLMAEESLQRSRWRSRVSILSAAAAVASVLLGAYLQVLEARRSAQELESFRKDQAALSVSLRRAEQLNEDRARSLDLALASFAATTEKLSSASGAQDAVPIVSPDKRFAFYIGPTSGMLNDLLSNSKVELPQELSGSKVLTAAAFSPDGRLCATATRPGNLWLWDPSTQRVLQKLSVPNESLLMDVVALTFSPEGRRLVAGLNTGLVLTWDLAPSGANAPKLVLRQHSQRILALSVVANGAELISISKDKACRWNMESGQQLDCITPDLLSGKRPEEDPPGIAEQNR